jgi:hypothetical protein
MERTASSSSPAYERDTADSSKATLTHANRARWEIASPSLLWKNTSSQAHRKNAESDCTHHFLQACAFDEEKTK